MQDVENELDYFTPNAANISRSLDVVLASFGIVFRSLQYWLSSSSPPNDLYAIRAFQQAVTHVQDKITEELDMMPHMLPLFAAYERAASWIGARCLRREGERDCGQTGRRRFEDAVEEI